MTGYVIDVTRRKEEEKSERQRQIWLERVLELGKTITAVTDWDKCLQTLHACVQKGLHFDRVGIFIYDPASETVQGTYGTDSAGHREDTTWFKISIHEDAGFDKVLSSPKGFQYIENLSKAIPRSEAHEMHGVAEHITVAVWAGDKPIAAIAADNGIHHQRMEEVQIEALRLFAGYAGFALENARLLEQLHNQEEQLRLALDAARMGTWTWHIPSGALTWSKQVQHLHGFSDDATFDQTNKMLWSVIYKPDVKMLLQTLQDTIDNAEQPSFQTIYRVHLKDGKMRWLEAMGQRIDDDMGQPVRIVGTIADITERKQAEVEREVLIDELESRNAELERFTYTVSHDLKSPLITIRGFLGLLERDIERGNQEKVVRDMERIHAAAGRMLNLLDDLLELSRIGRLTNPHTAVSLNTLAAEAIELVTGRIEEHHVAVIVQPDMPTVHVDRPRLVEVLQNLIDNAVKFLGEQPNPTIHIGAHQTETEIVCFVQDNGIGIEPKYLERIFNLFERLNPSVDGTGIGLALIKRIVEFHNGRIWAESAGTGQGTTFFFTLPTSQTNEKVL
jgi:PAS domain S-box-containing protein